MKGQEVGKENVFLDATRSLFYKKKKKINNIHRFLCNTKFIVKLYTFIFLLLFIDDDDDAELFPVLNSKLP